MFSSRSANDLGRRGRAVAVAGHNDVDTAERRLALHTLNIVVHLLNNLTYIAVLVHASAGIVRVAILDSIVPAVLINFAGGLTERCGLIGRIGGILRNDNVLNLSAIVEAHENLGLVHGTGTKDQLIIIGRLLTNVTVVQILVVDAIHLVDEFAGNVGNYPRGGR